MESVQLKSWRYVSHGVAALLSLIFHPTLPQLYLDTDQTTCELMRPWSIPWFGKYLVPIMTGGVMIS